MLFLHRVPPVPGLNSQQKKLHYILVSHYVLSRIGWGTHVSVDTTASSVDRDLRKGYCETGEKCRNEDDLCEELHFRCFFSESFS